MLEMQNGVQGCPCGCEFEDLSCKPIVLVEFASLIRIDLLEQNAAEAEKSTSLGDKHTQV